MSDWIVDLDNNTATHTTHQLTIKFEQDDSGEWQGMLGPAEFMRGITVSDFSTLLKEGDDAFRTAKGLPIQEWDFLDDEDEEW